MQIHNCEQYSPEWVNLRLGIITASNMSKVLAKGQGKTRARLMNDLISERLRGEPADSYSNHHMERGHEYESEAMEAYQEWLGQEVNRVGFITNHGVGCSPDGLASDRGCEIKTRMPGLHVDLMRTKAIPSEHKAQIQCSMWITGANVWDFVSYCPGLPLVVITAQADKKYITSMEDEVKAFYMELERVMNEI